MAEARLSGAGKILRKLPVLSPGEGWLLVRAVALITGFRMALVVVPFKTFLRWLDRPVSSELPSSPSSIRYMKRVRWAVTAAGHRLLGDKPCLTEALVAKYLLNKKGIPVDLRIGVAKTPDGAFQAHAWLEREGYILIGGNDSPNKYAPLPPVTTGKS